MAKPSEALCLRTSDGDNIADEQKKNREREEGWLTSIIPLSTNSILFNIQL